MSSGFSIVEGTPGITEQDITHLMIPGRNRSPDGMSLSAYSHERVVTAASFYLGHVLIDWNGIIITSGYKSLSDQAGQPWQDSEGAYYQGVPEAYSMKHELVTDYGIDQKYIAVEPKSIDTVTNFTNIQELFPDDRPVGIVAQRMHLDLILSIVAPRTMRRDYVGIIVPEIPGNPDIDPKRATMASRYIVRGLTPDHEKGPAIAYSRAKNVERAIRTSRRLGRITIGKINH